MLLLLLLMLLHVSWDVNTRSNTLMPTYFYVSPQASDHEINFRVRSLFCIEFRFFLVAKNPMRIENISRLNVCKMCTATDTLRWKWVNVFRWFNVFFSIIASFFFQVIVWIWPLFQFALTFKTEMNFAFYSRNELNSSLWKTHENAIKMKLESKFGILTMKRIDKPLQSESTSSFAVCHRAGHHKPILFASDADAAASLFLAVVHELKNISAARERK